MSNILLEFTIDAPPKDVYTAITQEEGVKGWWTSDTSVDQTVGGTAEFGFGGGGFTFEITQLKPAKHIEWKTLQAMPDWDGTRVTFDLDAANGGTKVLFGHRDFASEDGSFASVSYNWAYFMMSLKSYVENGNGTPYGA